MELGGVSNVIDRMEGDGWSVGEEELSKEELDTARKKVHESATMLGFTPHGALPRESKPQGCRCCQERGEECCWSWR